jgi:hypothetical protein
LRSRTSCVIWDRASISMRRSCIGFSGRSIIRATLATATLFRWSLAS